MGRKAERRASRDRRVVSELSRLSSDVSETRDDLVSIKERLAAHETRFGNGREVMAEIRDSISKNSRDIEDLKPKAPDWLKLTLAVLSVVGILMGAQLWMTDRFSDRPTHYQIEKMTGPIKAAQKETAKEIRDIEKSQSAQATSIKNIEASQKAQEANVDTILKRLPRRRSNR